ncbi:MAG: hypothetical protein KF852_03450 [Saprospiraceae bacterium]|nr:hypothetical protein [Saprospiraceae bacterium]
MSDTPKEKAKKELLLAVLLPAAMACFTLLNQLSKNRLEKPLILQSHLSILWIIVLIVSVGTLVHALLLLRKA